MVVEDRNDNLNPLIDTDNVTVNAFNAIKNREKSDENYILGQNDTTTWTSPNFKVKVKAWTQHDNQTHTYFHSLSIDVNVEDFMGTAELKCPYDSDLMEYWEPIRQTVVIYGSNRGDYKILFIGRVRGVKQDGYELVVEFQNYGWKFKQLVTQSYAKDNVLNKDGYTILRLMFEALKIDSWVISESAKNRLKEVGINTDGNLTLNGKEIEEVPDLFKRLKVSNPSKLVSKDTLNDKLREKYLHNIKDINYTLRYEKPTAVMKKISSEGNYSAGENVYDNAYASASSGGTSGTSGKLAVENLSPSSSIQCKPPKVKSFCREVPSNLYEPIQEIYLFNRNCTNSFAKSFKMIGNYASNYPDSYNSKVKPCLKTLEKGIFRSDGQNAATSCLKIGNSNADTVKAKQYLKDPSPTGWLSRELGKAAKNPTAYGAGVVKNVQNTLGGVYNWLTGR